MTKRSETVAFRLPAEFRGQLAEQAQRAGEKPNLLARKFVIHALTDARGERLEHGLLQIERGVEKVQRTLVTGVEAVLSELARAQPPGSQLTHEKLAHFIQKLRS